MPSFAKGPSNTAGGNEYPIGPIATAESPSTPTYDTPLQAKWFACFINEMMFGREIAVPRIDEQDHKVKVMEDNKEVEYKNIPKILLVIHPRDMGFNYVDYMTHRLLGIQLNNSNWILRPDEMIFWENKPDNPVYGSKFYGMADAQSMMGSARTLSLMDSKSFRFLENCSASSSSKSCGYGYSVLCQSYSCIKLINFLLN